MRSTMSGVNKMELHLISHALCPYVQRAVIALEEQGLAYRRTDIDLAAKPDWFLALSPLGKTPVLSVDGTALFESAAIVDFLDEIGPHPMHPADPLDRARHRAWIEVASVILAGIAGLYNAPTGVVFEAKQSELRLRFERVEAELGGGPWFAGKRFSLVDAAFAPVFRYFDAFDRLGIGGVLEGMPKIGAWREALEARPSVLRAVTPDYPERLMAFLARREGPMGEIAHTTQDGVA
jgi:glutathione S-transferase